MDTLAKKLLRIANKYALSHLFMLCENKLKSEINTDNAIELLMLADLHNSTYLKKGLSQLLLFVILELCHQKHLLRVNYDSCCSSSLFFFRLRTSMIVYTSPSSTVYPYGHVVVSPQACKSDYVQCNCKGIHVYVAR